MGSRLHLRLTGVFALIALIPTVLVAIFAVLTVNVGLEGWFSDRVRQVVGSSLTAAEAYRAEIARTMPKRIPPQGNPLPPATEDYSEEVPPPHAVRRRPKEGTGA